ncbi:hypothetical protein ABC382_00665 [Lysinibacillus sp. 1P01SD]|uniref:hypothetical protein n=1 Tax=Lysinibacillus sp. 1P01SD TaxID=3132285 RepID=UPI0039A02208
MKKNVVFVEKRNFAKLLADGLELKKGRETSSYFEVEASPIFPNGAVFTWGNSLLYELGILISVERIPKEQHEVIQKEKMLYHTTLASYYWNSYMPLSLDLLKDAYTNHYQYMFAEEHLVNVINLLTEADSILHVHDGDTSNIEAFNLLCNLIVDTINTNFREQIEQMKVITLESEYLKELFENQNNLTKKSDFGLKDNAFEKSLLFLKVILKK